MPKTSTTFKKGNKVHRPKGSENKATKDIREAFRLLIEGNLDNMTAWLKRVAVTDPDKALKIVGDLSEFILPKLSRAELTGKDGDKLETQTVIQVQDEETANKLREIERKIKEREGQ